MDENTNPTAAEKLKALQAAMAKIEKDFGKGSVMKMGDIGIENVDIIPTGSLALNAALGVGGERAEAEQTVEVLRSVRLVARKIFAFPVLKEFIVLAHGLLPTGSPVFTLLSMPLADHLAISAAGSNFPCFSSRMTVEPPYSK